MDAGALREITANTVNRLARAVRSDVIDETASRYNITKRRLSRSVYIKRAGRGVAAASVNLKIRAVPLDEFGARVRMTPLRGRDSLGRRFNRKAASVSVKIYRGGGRKTLPGAFPLFQRTPGALREPGTVRKRTSAARNKLTVLRFYTFPTDYREALLSDIAAQLPGDFGVAFDAAVRKLDKGGNRVLRGNA